MAGRALTDMQRSWLVGEVADWRAAGIVSPEQGERILSRYESTAEAGARKRGQASFALVAVSLLLVGLAALLLIGYNWEAMPRLAKLAVLFGAVAGTHAVGLLVRYKRQASTASELVFFLGCLFYGAGIWLIAQIFHLDAHYPDGFWWWAVGVLPFALCLDTLLLHGLFVALLALWAGTEVLGFGHLGGWLFGRWQDLPNGAYSLPLLALPGLLWAYRKESVGAISMYAPLLAWWVVLQPFAWHVEASAVYFIGSVGALFLIVSGSHRPGSPFAIPYRLYGALLAIGALVPLSYYDFNTGTPREAPTAALGLQGMVVIVVLLSLTVALAALAKGRQAGEAQGLGARVGEIVRGQWLPVSLGLFMALLAFWHGAFSERSRSALVPTVLANVGLVVFAIGLMRLGIHEERGRPFAAGVACFLLWATLRYIDLFGGAGGMLGAALMFFLCGATLFGLATYWRGRKVAHHV